MKIRKLWMLIPALLISFLLLSAGNKAQAYDPDAIAWPEESCYLQWDAAVSCLGEITVSDLNGISQISIKTPYTTLTNENGDTIDAALVLAFGTGASQEMKQNGYSVSSNGMPVIYWTDHNVNRLPVLPELHMSDDYINNGAKPGTYTAKVTYQLNIIDTEGVKTTEALTQTVILEVPIAINEINFPDENFRTVVADWSIDQDNDGYLTKEEIAAVTSLDVSWSNIESLQGIEYFTGLTELNCYLTDLTALDISRNTALTYLDCSYTGLTSLDVSMNTALLILKCGFSQLTSLDVSKNTALTMLDCSGNQLTSLDVSKNTALTALYCDDNQLTSLDVSKNTALTGLYCNDNQLTSLDVGKNTALTALYCANNLLAGLNLQNDPDLNNLWCYGNTIELLDISPCPTLVNVYENGTVTDSTDYKEYYISGEGCLRVDHSAEASPSPAAVRIFGNTRYKTSLQIAETLKEATGYDKFAAMILVSGEDFPDGLSASCLAVKYNAPIITTSDKKSRYTAANNYILENLVPGGTVYIVGGTKVIPEEAIAALSDIHCVRLAGNTRYLTNMAVLGAAGIQGGSEVLIATGTDFPDSLSVSSVDRPLFLVNGEKGTLTNAQKTYLKKLAAEDCTFTIIGGTGAVSENLKELIRECTGTEPDRIAGSTRYKTSAAIAERYFPNASRVILGYGENFPDALCAGPLAAVLNAPVLLTMTGKASAINAARAFTTGNGIHKGIVLGGSGLISDKDFRTILGVWDQLYITVK